LIRDHGASRRRGTLSSIRPDSQPAEHEQSKMTDPKTPVLESAT
jgi:hypothetical protein